MEDLSPWNNYFVHALTRSVVSLDFSQQKPEMLDLRGIKEQPTESYEGAEIDLGTVYSLSITNSCMKVSTPHSALLLAFCFTHQASAKTVILQPSEDTTLHQTTPDSYLASQANLAAGSTMQGAKTRALLRFDLKGTLPTNTTIIAATLTVKVTKQPSSGGLNSTFDLRRVLTSWGEATWNVRSASSEAWSLPGGRLGTDFSSQVSASTPIRDRGSYTFATTPSLVTDVQQWLIKPEENFGWVLLSQAESTRETARRFGSREDPANTSNLTVEYTLAPIAEPIHITDITVQNDAATRTWTGGKPSFQVQRRAAVHEGTWVPTGDSRQNRSVTIPLEGTAAFFRVAEVTAATEMPNMRSFSKAHGMPHRIRRVSRRAHIGSL
ncbi:MAG: DNRLRE domain-containing protein [Pedosphaera sp.]|nr:DNRLRE domain-containing protein [Pedosphaera sp.]